MTDSTTIRVWEYLDRVWSAHDPMPTVREVQAELGLSSTSVALYHLRKLRSAGVVRWDEKKSRCMWLLMRYHHD